MAAAAGPAGGSPPKKTQQGELEKLKPTQCLEKHGPMSLCVERCTGPKKVKSKSYRNDSMEIFSEQID